VIVRQKKGKGRPKKKVPVVQYVTKDEEVVNEDDGDVEQVIINKPKKEKLSAKDLKMIELQEKIVELEAVSGKKIRATRKGTVDKRSTKQPTEKQIAARKKFVEANKLRAIEKKKKKEEDEKLKNKENVKQVVGELAELKKQNQMQKEQLQAQLQKEQEQAKPKPPPNPYENLI
jgi:Ni,Fe-hydrogenase I large subunit